MKIPPFQHKISYHIEKPLEQAIHKIRDEISTLAFKIMFIKQRIITLSSRPFGTRSCSLLGGVIKATRQLSHIFRPALKPTNAYSYTYTPRQLSSEDVISDHLPYAALASSTLHKDESWIEPWGMRYWNISDISPSVELPEGIESHSDCFFSPISGMKAFITERDNTIIIAFAPLFSSHTELPDQEHKKMVENQKIQVYSNIFLGSKPLCCQHADQLVQTLLQHPLFKDHQVVLTGQCLGGMMAQYTAINNKLPARCFNTAPLGAGLQQKLGSKKLKEASSYVTHLSAAGDYVSDFTVYDKVFRIFDIIGLRVPGNFGKRYIIPTAYHHQDWGFLRGAKNTHDYVLGSIMNHIGYNYRSHSGDLSDEITSKASFTSKKSS
ncbi:MAG: hypothetical protein ACQEP8_05635 [Chlamydiota bacterium]